MRDQVKWVCTGTCGAVVSDEEHKKGLTVCGTERCTRRGQPFEKRYSCHICKQLYGEHESHSHEIE